MMTALPRLRPWLMTAIVFVIAFDVAFLWQRVGGAYRSEFGGHPDEAAHYVTGLMIRDYLAAGCPGSPMKFAEDYYVHYPKIGLGVWPPFFYLVQAAWTLPFGVSRTSVLLLMCALAAVVSTLIYRALQEEYGQVAAALGGGLFLSLPLVREYDAMIMAEMLCAALMFGAALAWGRFLDREKRSDAVWFGVLAGLAILTKGTGMALALMAPLALGLTRKWHLLAKPALWMAAAITAILAGPWTWHFRNEGRLKGGWLQPNPSWSFTREAVPYYAGKLAVALGVIVVVLAMTGLICMLLRRARLEETNPNLPANSGRWIAAGALIASVFVFQIIMPVGLEARHLISVLPACVMFAIAGLKLKRGPSRATAEFETQTSSANQWGMPLSSAQVLLIPGLFVCVAVILNFFLFVPGKHWSGFRPLAELVLADEAHPKSTVLISSDASGEGMFISELAMHEKRPGHTVQRASKLLATMSWSGAEYHARFTEDAQLADFLSQSEIAWIVVDDSMPENKRGAHQAMLKRVCEGNPERFHLAGSEPVVRGGSKDFPPIRAYTVLRRN